jgi:hypothetical protein
MRSIQRAVTAQQALLADSSGRDRMEIAKKLQQLYQEQEGLEAQMRSADARLISMPGNQTVNAEQVQHRLLDEHSVLLSYWIGERLELIHPCRHRSVRFTETGK